MNDISPALFREEARSHALGAAPGVTVVKIPSLLRWAARLLPLIGFAAALALSSVQYARKERVTGVLASSLGSSRITATIAGTVVDVRVSPGEKVAKEQVLAVIAPDLSRFGGRAAAREKLNAARHRREEVDRQIENTKVQNELLVQRISGSIAASELERKALVEQLGIQDQITVRLHNQVRVAVQLADKKIISQRDAEQRENLLDDARVRSAELNRDLARLDGTVLQARSDLSASSKELKLTLSRLSIQALEIDAEISNLRGEAAVEVLSPVAGTVDYVAYHPGQVAIDGSLLFSVIPTGSHLSAELFVPSRAIARVKVGQPVRIEFDAFPAEFFGYGTGYITSINETLLDPVEARAYGATVNSQVYRLVAALSAQSMEDRQQKVSLRAGMTFSADILLEKHPLFGWAWNELTRIPKAL